MNPQIHVPYSLEKNGADSLVFFNNLLTPLFSVIENQRKEDPTKAKIAYHDLAEAPTATRPGDFTVSQKHCVVFNVEKGSLAVKAEEDGNLHVSQSHIGNLIPAMDWDNEVTGLVFIVKWAPQGLSPVRPVVALLKSISLPAGKAVEVA